MSLVWHLVQSDAQRFRWVITLWCLLVAAQSVAIGVQPGTIDDARMYASIDALQSLIWLTTQIGMLFLVPAVIQAHAAVGTDAFWMTRPIPRASLWTAKVILLSAVTVLVPTAAEMVLMRVTHMPGGEIARVAADTFLSRLVWLGIVMTVAVVTANLARFALVAGATVMALIVTMFIVLSRLRVATYAPPPTLPGLPAPFDPTVAILGEVGVAAAALLLVFLQYRTRLRRVAVPAGVVLVVLVMTLGPYWPFPVLRPPSMVPAWAQDARAVQLTARSPQIAFDQYVGFLPSRSEWRTGRSEVDITSVAPGWQAQTMLLDSSFTLPDKRRIDGRGNRYRASLSVSGSRQYPARAVARQVLGVNLVGMSEPPYAETALMMMAPAKDLDEVSGATGSYHGRFGVYLIKWDEVGTLPLQPGATFQDGSYRMGIENVMKLPHALLLRTRETRASSSFDRAPERSYAFYLRNPRRAEAVAGQVANPPAEIPLGGFFGISWGQRWGFSTRGVQIAFPPSGFQGEPPSLDSDWFAGAELVIVRMTEAGAVERTLDVAAMTLGTR